MDNFVNIINQSDYQIGKFAKSALEILNQTLLTINYQHHRVEVAIILVDEAKSLQLNQLYRKKDYVADVLSFNVSQSDELFVIKNEFDDLGDIYICYPLASTNAKKYGHSLFRELAFLFLHGLLHNLGYDHETLSDEKIMFDLQNEILSALKIERFATK